MTVSRPEDIPPELAPSWRDEAAERIEFAPPDRPTPAEMVARIVGAARSPPSVEEFWRLSRGDRIRVHEVARPTE